MSRAPLARRLAVAATLGALVLPSFPARAGGPAAEVRRERARARRLTDKKHISKAMQEARGKGTSPCQVLGAEAVAAGKDVVLRNVDPGFLQAITTLDTARSVAKRKAKKVKGHTITAAQWGEVAGSTCQSEVDDLKAQRKKLEKTAPKASAAPAACKALDRKLEHTCWAGLRAGRVPDACQQVASTFQMVQMGAIPYATACKQAR